MERVAAQLLGLLAGVILVKLGNPVIFSDQLQAPGNFFEWCFMSWPPGWSFWMLALAMLVSLPLWRWKTNVPAWLLGLPLLWLGWQWVAARWSVDARLTAKVLPHFAACVGAFYVGVFAMGRLRRDTLFWAGLLAAFAWVLYEGWDQHFGGLAATRRHFETMDWSQAPPGLRVAWESAGFRYKIMSDRIFSTFVYPNALAGAILLLLPPLLAWLAVVWRKQMAALLLLFLALPCLYWSGSKAGWLIALVLGLVWVLHLSLGRRARLLIVGAVLLVGVTAFFLRFSTYFAKGATSAGARFEYWQAAWGNFKAHPVVGSGPGTFGAVYRKVKSPGAEMARLTHNDYLEQASDSGGIGGLAYAAFWLVGLVWGYRNCAAQPMRLAIWLGLLGWSLQGFVEFGLYIPALACPAFLLFGLLAGQEEEKQVLPLSLIKGRIPLPG
ncbi:MAG: O-antigen ligase family protein [Verrucomicrobiota bacterium]